MPNQTDPAETIAAALQAYVDAVGQAEASPVKSAFATVMARRADVERLYLSIPEVVAMTKRNGSAMGPMDGQPLNARAVTERLDALHSIAIGKPDGRRHQFPRDKSWAQMEADHANALGAHINRIRGA